VHLLINWGLRMLEPVEQFRAALAGRGILPKDGEVIADGRIHRCDAEGRGGKGDAAYLLHLDGIPAGGFENWRDGFGWQNWRAEPARTLSPAEEAAHRANLKKAQRERELEEGKRHANARKLANSVLESAALCDFHPYTARKGIRAHGARVQGDRLVIPLRDVEGAIHSLQFIGADGEKRFLTGGRKAGCYFEIGRPVDVLCVAEGFATGASIHEATGYAVAVAFDAGNLGSVAKALREKHPDVQLIVCADDDHQTAGNPGLSKATEAALSTGALLAVPAFDTARPEKATDFNDLHHCAGLDAVRRCIESAVRPSEPNDDPPQADEGEELGGAVPSHGEAATSAPAPDAGPECKFGGGRFRLTPRGVFYIAKDGNTGLEKMPQWICGGLAVVAATRDAKSNAWGRLLEWRDADGVRHQWAMPLELLQGDGVDVRRELAQAWPCHRTGPLRRVNCWRPMCRCGRSRTGRGASIGWAGRARCTSPRRNPSASAASGWCFRTRTRSSPHYSVAGTAEDWRDSVARWRRATRAWCSRSARHSLGRWRTCRAKTPAGFTFAAARPSASPRR
jgi:phage/plasmid primase-like uncharacterized protein